MLSLVEDVDLLWVRQEPQMREHFQVRHGDGAGLGTSVSGIPLWLAHWPVARQVLSQPPPLPPSHIPHPTTSRLCDRQQGGRFTTAPEAAASVFVLLSFLSALLLSFRFCNLPAASCLPDVHARCKLGRKKGGKFVVFFRLCAAGRVSKQTSANCPPAVRIRRCEFHFSQLCSWLR